MRTCLSLAVVLCISAMTLLPVSGQDDLGERASWSMLDSKQVKGKVNEWLSSKKLDDLAKLKVEALWPKESANADNEDALVQVATTIALVDARVKPLLSLVQGERQASRLPKFEVLKDEKVSAFARDNLRLIYGRWLVQNDLYDEALEQLEGLTTKHVVAPDALLFYQSASYHRLLKKDKCLPTLTKLLENEKTLPKRFATLARLMEADLKPLKKDSLDEVARLMENIRRRLDLGRAGKRVRKEEDDVIAKLDKMIEDLEKQRQQQQQQQSGQNGSNQSNRPAQDSGNLPGSGPGNIDPRKLGKDVDWGKLPPKERQETLQRITKDLPAHYREVIEAYFKKIAAEGG